MSLDNLMILGMVIALVAVVLGTTANAAGHVYLGGGTRVQKAVGVEDTVEDMYTYLTMNTPVPEAELRRAKDHLKGSLMLSLESTSSRMSHLARQEIYFGRHFTMDEVLKSNNISRSLNFADIKSAHKYHKPAVIQSVEGGHFLEGQIEDRKSTRLNSSHT